MRKSSLFMAVSLCVFSIFSLSSSAQVRIKTGDKLAFLGDSITQYGNYPIGYLNLVVSGLKANGISIQKIPAGISGNKSPQMLARLQRDVLSKTPQFMTLSCGVNDVWHGAYNPKRGVALPDYRVNITKIIDQAQKAGIEVIILTSTMITENQKDKKNQTLIAYNNCLKDLAKDKKCVLVDLNADMQSELEALRKAYPGIKGNLLTGDGVHMNPMGNMMMARGVLRGLGLNDDQLKKAENAWMSMKFWQHGLNFTLADYLRFAKRSNQHRMSVNLYIAELIRRELALCK